MSLGTSEGQLSGIRGFALHWLLFFWEDLTPKAEVLTAFSDEGVRGRGVCRDFASES